MKRTEHFGKEKGAPGEKNQKHETMTIPSRSSEEVTSENLPGIRKTSE